MSSADCTPGSLGWFGKIPGLGDFVGRGLPASLVRNWDAWLSAELSEARALLAEGWAAAYAEAPALCFLLGAGLLDGHAWQGILLPSLDRVGREYPLTIAQCRGSQPTEGAPPPGWWGSLVSLGQRIRDCARSADAVDEALAVLVHPPLAGQPLDPDPWGDSRPILVEPGKSAWWRFAAEEGAAPLPADFNGLPRGAALRELFGLTPGAVER